MSRLRLQRRPETEGKESDSVANRSVDNSKHSHSKTRFEKEEENMEEKSGRATELREARVFDHASNELLS